MKKEIFGCSVWRYCDFYYPWILEHKEFSNRYKFGMFTRIIAENYELLYDRKMVVILVDDIPQTMIYEHYINEVLYNENMISITFDNIKNIKYLVKDKKVLDFVSNKCYNELSKLRR